MKGFELYNGNQDFRVVDGSRTVLTTQGMLVNLLPPAYDISMTFDVAFPDFAKDYRYQWQHLFEGPVGGQVRYNSGALTELTIIKQEADAETNLMASPSNTDIFVGSIVMNRTNSPSHSWGGSSIDPLQPMGKKISFVSGSLQVEAEFGMARVFSIYVSGGQLKLHWEQSVSEPPGGWNSVYGVIFDYTSGYQYNGGGENVYGSNPGISVQLAHTKLCTQFFRAPFPPMYYDERARRGGAEPCALPNPSDYDYSSTYQVTLTGAFGRRS